MPDSRYTDFSCNYVWILNAGMSPILYLTLNKSVRKAFVELMKLQKPQVSTAGITVIPSTYDHRRGSSTTMPSNLPPPLIDYVIDNADPSTLFKLSTLNFGYREIIWRRRGLPIDTLILRRSSVCNIVSRARQFLKGTRLKLASVRHPDRGLTLKCDLDNAEVAKLLERVTVWKQVIIKNELNDESAVFVANSIKLGENVELRVDGLKFGSTIWSILLKMAWKSLDFGETVWRPSLELLVPHSETFERLRFNAVNWTDADIESIENWNPKSRIRHLVMHEFNCCLYPKLWADFIEDNLHHDSSIEILYDWKMGTNLIDEFQRSLIKWMNRMSGDWAMIGNKGVDKRRLLIKVGKGSGDAAFEARFARYVLEQLPKKKSTLPIPKKAVPKVLLKALNRRRIKRELKDANNVPMMAMFQLQLWS
uniref:F-box domain-containing protein n=1 Tax=Panagrellus redivivus TaxID=6233 RepID=A0A7E4ZQL6_PANRE